MPNNHAMSTGRRRLLQAGAALGVSATLSTATALRAKATATPPQHGGRLPYPDVADTSYATEDLARVVKGFFTAKSLHQGAAMVAFFAAAPTPVIYIDAGIGAQWPSQASLLQVWSNPPFSSAPPDALSYPLRIIGDLHSAVIEFVDTPELLGSEFRFISSLTFDQRGKIVRWIDYWDGRSALANIPIGTFGPYPTEADFRDGQGPAAGAITKAASSLQAAFAAGDPATATGLFTPDALYEDMALHARVEGQLQIQRYLTRALPSLPYGPGASVANVTGSAQGGGYEWHAPPSAAPLVRGHTALQLDASGAISRFTVIYDSYKFPDATYRALGALSLEATTS
jgi:hypothetical protein